MSTTTLDIEALAWAKQDGLLPAIVQDADELFRPGERVRLLSDGRKTRVTH